MKSLQLIQPRFRRGVSLWSLGSVKVRILCDAVVGYVAPIAALLFGSCFMRMTLNIVETMIDRWRTHILCIALSSSLSIASAIAQDDNTKLQLAQAYEQAGDHERAVQIYEELFAEENGRVS